MLCTPQVTPVIRCLHNISPRITVDSVINMEAQRTMQQSKHYPTIMCTSLTTAHRMVTRPMQNRAISLRLWVYPIFRKQVALQRHPLVMLPLKLVVDPTLAGIRTSLVVVTCILQQPTILLALLKVIMVTAQLT